MIFRISACRRRPGRDQARSRPARTAQRRYPPACAPGEVGLAQGQRQAAQVLAIERHDVEGVELHLVVMLAGMQGVEVCDAVDAEHDRLAVDDEAGLAHLACRLDNPLGAHVGEGDFGRAVHANDSADHG
jgi:hypothetical protein